ncbi:hypothetical protein U1Q18_037459, partial [Sarracenia purpurea var. burkii]
MVEVTNYVLYPFQMLIGFRFQCCLEIVVSERVVGQSLCSGSDSSILAVTEGSQLSIWDLRMKENGGCIRRISGSVGDMFYAVCSSSTGIAVGGADRTVTIYDTRRWSALSRWVHCSKYEITGLAFSSIDSDYIYIQGVDYEVFCGQWRESKKVMSFRGDSNWLGFSKCANRDVLGGWCDSGSIFVADITDQIEIHTVDVFCDGVPDADASTGFL